MPLEEVVVAFLLILATHGAKENGNYYSISGLYSHNGKENGNYYSILGLYRDNGKENGNYYNILGALEGYRRILEPLQS